MSLETKSFSLEELAKHHEQTQSVVHRYVTEADYQAMATKAMALDALIVNAMALDALIVKAQSMIAVHLPDPDADDKELVGKLIALFDGEEQRKAQSSMPVKSLRELRAQYECAGFIRGVAVFRHAQTFGGKFNVDESANELADRIRKGLE